MEEKMMTLAQFIKELKHNSLFVKVEEGGGITFEGTIGDLKRTEWYLEKVGDYLIDMMWFEGTTLFIDLD